MNDLLSRAEAKKLTSKEEFEAAFLRYQYGLDGFPQDNEKFIFWLNKAIKKDSLEAFDTAGRLYHYGEVVEKNLEKALYWYKLAAEGGYKNAYLPLAILYYRKWEKQGGTQEEEDQMIYWCKKAVDANIRTINTSKDKNDKENAYCHFLENLREFKHSELRNIITEGFQSTTFYKKALDGDTDAQYLSFVAYSNAGLLEEAFLWAEKAALQGYKYGMYAVGHAYLNGSGICKNEEKGVYWLQKSAHTGCSWAQEELGYYYLGKDNKQLARKYFQMGIENPESTDTDKERLRDSLQSMLFY